MESRQENLLTATQQWIDFEAIKAFTDICESRWRQTGELSKEQLAWLKWARDEAIKLHPFAKNYPDPVADGQFDPNNIPVGGPYPKINLLEEKKPSEPIPPEIRTVFVETKQEFPWWLLHRRRY